MDSKILLGKILQRFADKRTAKVEGYSEFGYIRETDNSIYVTRENGQNTPISFSKILSGIQLYQTECGLYDNGPSILRKFGITHVTSPVWSLLHLLKKVEYEALSTTKS